MTDQTQITPVNSTLPNPSPVLLKLATFALKLIKVPMQLPLSKRNRDDIGLTPEHSAYNARDEAINIASRHGMPL